MPITIFQQTAGALIPTGERTVAVYPSGLCRVDQRYVCESSAADTHRATLVIGADMPDGNDDPTIDGLKVFPAPQEIKRPEGFTEFVVSAYGRATSDYANYQPEVKTYISQGFFYSVWETQGSITIKRGESFTYDDLGLPDDYTEPFNITPRNVNWSVNYAITVSTTTRSEVNWDGTVILVESKRLRINYTANELTNDVYISYKSPLITVEDKRNFGDFTELDITTRVPIDGDGLSETPDFA